MSKNLQDTREKSNYFDKDAIKHAFSPERMARYAAEKKGVKPTRVSGGWRIGSHGASSGLHIDDDGLWYDHSEPESNGDCFDLVWRYDFDGDGKMPNERFREVAGRAAEICGGIPADFNAQRTFTPKEAKDTPKDKDAQKAKFDAFMSMYWEILRDGLKSVACDNLFTLRGLPQGKVRDLQNIGYTEQAFQVDVPYLFSSRKLKPIIPANSFIVRNANTHTIKVISFGADGKRRRDNTAVKQLGACVWMPWNDIPDGDLYLTEGETSAMALLFAGLNAMPLKPEGAAVEILQRLPENHRVFLAYDCDEGGKGYTAKAARIAPDAVDISRLWGEGNDPNDYAAKHKDNTRAEITKALPDLIKQATQEREENRMPAEYIEPLKAMEKCKKPTPNKSGELLMEYERGDIAPLCAWLEKRGIFQELFTDDNGLRKADGKPLTNADLTREQLAIQKWGEMPAMGTSGPKLMKQAAEKVADENQRDALRESINNLPEWDGVKRIDTFWNKYCGAKQNETTQGIARYMWTAIIGRALATDDKPCKADMCVILKGAQGIGKTSLVSKLALNNSWLCTLSQQMPEDEIKRALRLAQFVEIGEMSEATKTQREAIKRILTAEKIKMRKKGVDDFWEFPMRAFFIATSDNADGILNDPNGLRRWLPVDVFGFIPIKRGKDTQYVMDTDGVERDKPQLYAEAKALYMDRILQGLNGVWWDAVPLEGQRAATAREIVQDENADMVYQWFEENKPQAATLCSICAQVFYMTRDVYARDKQFQMRLSDALKLRGFKKKKCRGSEGNCWYWYHPDFENDNSEF